MQNPPKTVHARMDKFFMNTFEIVEVIKWEPEVISVRPEIAHFNI